MHCAFFKTIKEKSLQVLNVSSFCAKTYHQLTLKLTVPFPSASNMRNISSMKTLALSLGMRYMAMIPSLSRAPPGHSSINPLRNTNFETLTGHLFKQKSNTDNNFIKHYCFLYFLCQQVHLSSLPEPFSDVLLIVPEILITLIIILIPDGYWPGVPL